MSLLLALLHSPRKYTNALKLKQRLHISKLFLIVFFLIALIEFGMPRISEKIHLPINGIGARHFLTIHKYQPTIGVSLEKAYIQATLHADEIPGLLVSHHLIRMLDDAEKKGNICKEIIIVPYANPIGLSQNLLGSHLGRFSLETGVNFNRDWVDVTKNVASAVDGKLLKDDPQHNVNIIRNAMVEETEKIGSKSLDKFLKQALYKIACTADVVLDLHCDTDAVMHMYTHTRLWPELSDLAAELGSECHLLAPWAGGNPFDESMSCPWADLADQFKDFPIPMACQSATVELRGELDVNDEYARTDAHAIYRFLQRRGYISGDITPSSLPPLIRPAAPLSGVDMIEASKAGVVCWRVKAGDLVEAGDILGEIVDIEDPDAPRVPVTTSATGIIFGMRSHRLVRPGQIIIKVSGAEPLEWRKGNLLTSR